MLVVFQAQNNGYVRKMPSLLHVTYKVTCHIHHAVRTKLQTPRYWPLQYCHTFSALCNLLQSSASVA